MNLVGKIFVVLILLASTVFMTMGLMVFATHRNWQEEVMATSQRRDRGLQTAAETDQMNKPGSKPTTTNCKPCSTRKTRPISPRWPRPKPNASPGSN